MIAILPLALLQATVESTEVCVLPMDLMFLIDGSLSINDAGMGGGPNTFEETVLPFVSNVAASFQLGSNNSRVGVVTFASWATVDIRLDQFADGDEDALAAAIQTIPYPRGMTYTGLGLRFVRAELMAPGRGIRPSSVNAPRMLVLITDGRPSTIIDHTVHGNIDPAPEIAMLKAQNVSIFTVGIGSSTSQEQLDEWSSEPTAQHTLRIEAFDGLVDFIETLTTQVCTAASATASPTADPTASPSDRPTKLPTANPTARPTAEVCPYWPTSAPSAYTWDPWGGGAGGGMSTNLYHPTAAPTISWVCVHTRGDLLDPAGQPQQRVCAHGGGGIVDTEDECSVQTRIQYPSAMGVTFVFAGVDIGHCYAEFGTVRIGSAYGDRNVCVYVGRTPNPTAILTANPTIAIIATTDVPTVAPTVPPTKSPTADPTVGPTATPITSMPTRIPTKGPSGSNPSVAPTTSGPTTNPSAQPTANPTQIPTANPTVGPTIPPSAIPTANPTANPTIAPTAVPTIAPTVPPTKSPTADPTVGPTAAPTTSMPTRIPTKGPSGSNPSVAPTTSGPTMNPSAQPTANPTQIPTANPTANPTATPSSLPTRSTPTLSPTASPTSSSPSLAPSRSPTAAAPTLSPTTSPATFGPTASPSAPPTVSLPTISPTDSPTTASPTESPTGPPTSSVPTAPPTVSPTTASPSTSPTTPPTARPTFSPTKSPSSAIPTSSPSKSPTPVFMNPVVVEYFANFTAVIPDGNTVPFARAFLVHLAALMADPTAPEYLQIEAVPNRRQRRMRVVNAGGSILARVRFVDPVHQERLAGLACASWDITFQGLELEGRASASGTLCPTAAPTSSSPTAVPTSSSPTADPTGSPSRPPSSGPTIAPTMVPPGRPTLNPTAVISGDLSQNGAEEEDIAQGASIAAMTATLLALLTMSLAWIIVQRRRQQPKEVAEKPSLDGRLSAAVVELNNIRVDIEAVVPVATSAGSRLWSDFRRVVSFDGLYFRNPIMKLDDLALQDSYALLGISCPPSTYIHHLRTVGGRWLDLTFSDSNEKDLVEDAVDFLETAMPDCLVERAIDLLALRALQGGGDDLEGVYALLGDNMFPSGPSEYAFLVRDKSGNAQMNPCAALRRVHCPEPEYFEIGDDHLWGSRKPVRHCFGDEDIFANTPFAKAPAQPEYDLVSSQAVSSDPAGVPEYDVATTTWNVPEYDEAASTAEYEATYALAQGEEEVAYALAQGEEEVTYALADAGRPRRTSNDDVTSKYHPEGTSSSASSAEETSTHSLGSFGPTEPADVAHAGEEAVKYSLAGVRKPRKLSKGRPEWGPSAASSTEETGSDAVQAGRSTQKWSLGSFGAVAESTADMDDEVTYSLACGKPVDEMGASTCDNDTVINVPATDAGASNRTDAGASNHIFDNFALQTDRTAVPDCIKFTPNGDVDCDIAEPAGQGSSESSSSSDGNLGSEPHNLQPSNATVDYVECASDGRESPIAVPAAVDATMPNDTDEPPSRWTELGKWFRVKGKDKPQKRLTPCQVNANWDIVIGEDASGREPVNRMSSLDV